MNTFMLAVNIICAVFVIALSIANIRFESEKSRIPLNWCNLAVFSVLIFRAISCASHGKELVVGLLVCYLLSVYFRHDLIAQARNRECNRLQSVEKNAEHRIAELRKELEESKAEQQRQFDEITNLRQIVCEYRENNKGA